MQVYLVAGSELGISLVRKAGGLVFGRSLQLPLCETRALFHSASTSFKSAPLEEGHYTQSLSLCHHRRESQM
jgi:hypothetical protein